MWSLLTAVGGADMAVHVPRCWDDARQVFAQWGPSRGVTGTRSSAPMGLSGPPNLSFCLAMHEYVCPHLQSACTCSCAGSGPIKDSRMVELPHP